MMLGKTAGGLFWMCRYLERAESVARLVEAGWHMALTQSASADSNEWESILITAGILDAYKQKYDTFATANVVNFMLRDRDNVSSVMSNIELARQNARIVRTALSSEVWEATNEAWMTLREILARPVTDRNLHDTLATIRLNSSVVRGALHGTMLRNDIFAFARLGTFIERADNTARILDVKYYVLLPSAAFVGTSMDNAQWEVILRSVSAERSYRWVTAGDSSAKGIAEFLILDARMPRSVAFCISKVRQYLGHLAEEYGTRLPSHDLADQLDARIRNTDIEAVFQTGLHEFLGEFISDNIRLANHIERDFRFYG